MLQLQSTINWLVHKLFNDILSSAYIL